MNLWKEVSVTLLFPAIVLFLASCGGGRNENLSPYPSNLNYEAQTTGEAEFKGAPINPAIMPEQLLLQSAVAVNAESNIALFLQDGKNTLITSAPVKIVVEKHKQGELVASVVAIDEFRLKDGFLGFLRFDGEALSPMEIEWGREVFAEGSTIVFSAEVAHHIALAGVIPNSEYLFEAPTNATILRITFSLSPQNLARQSSLAPRGEGNKVMPMLTKSGNNFVLSFEERNVGDYNLDGTVSIADVSALAERFLRSQSDADWGERDLVVDGDANGVINIADITAIAQNFFTNLFGYDVEFAFMESGGTGEPQFARIENPNNPLKPTLERVIPGRDDGWQTYFFELPALGFGTYYARVVPIGRDLEDRGIPSEVVSDAIVNLPPNPPSDFHSIGFTKNSVSLAWNPALEPDVVGYHLYYTDNADADTLEEFVQANAVIIPKDVTQFTVGELTTNVTYYFVIASEDAVGLLSELEKIMETKISVEVLDLPPVPPADFSVSATDYTSVTLAWTVSAETDVTGYNIYYTDIEGARFNDFTLAPSMPLAPDVAEFTVDGLTEFTTYYFVISAVDEAAQESPEADIMATQVSAVTVVLPIAVATIREKDQYGQLYEDYPVTFSADGSYSPAGANLIEFTWDYGDGTPTETLPAPGTSAHAYPDPTPMGFTVTLTVKDEFGAEATTTVTTGSIAALTETRILLVWNVNSPDVDGVIKDYYGSPYTGRGIPAEFVLGLDLSMDEVIDRNAYDTTIRDPIRDYLTTTEVDGIPLKNIIHYIVTTKDVPLKISGSGGIDGTQASVDADLTMVFETYDIAGATYNPYYGWESSDVEDIGNMVKSQPWQPFSFTATEPNIPGFGWDGTVTSTIDYLVTRLSAYTLEETLAMIDRCLNPFQGGEYIVVFDDDPKPVNDSSRIYDRMHLPDQWNTEPVTSVFNRFAWSQFDDNTDKNLIATDLGADANIVLGYVSHGVHARLEDDPLTNRPSNYILNELQFQYLPGALFNTYESFNGWTFRDPSLRNGQGLIADFIRMGGTGGVGNVWEPYGQFVADESFVFPEYFGGRNLAEACYKGILAISWKQTVIGDPLTTVDIQ